MVTEPLSGLRRASDADPLRARHLHVGVKRAALRHEDPITARRRVNRLGLVPPRMAFRPIRALPIRIVEAYARVDRRSVLGGHVHVSLKDKSGTNLFAREKADTNGRKQERWFFLLGERYLFAKPQVAISRSATTGVCYPLTTSTRRHLARPCHPTTTTLPPSSQHQQQRHCPCPSRAPP